MSMTLAERIAELSEQHGSLRAAARVLDVDAGYLSRLASGEKVEPSAYLLRKVGLRRVVTYERAPTKWSAISSTDPGSERRTPSDIVERLGVQYAARQAAALRGDKDGVCNANHWLMLIASEHWHEIIADLRAASKMPSESATETDRTNGRPS